MKKNILISILIMFTLAVKAQENINISIYKKVSGPYLYIVTKIVNNNSMDILIPGLSMIEDNGFTVDNTPSYIYANIYDTSGKKVNSEIIQRPFYRTPEWRSQIIIKAGQSYERFDHIVHGDGYYGLIDKDIISSAKTIEIVAHLKYILLNPNEKDKNRVETIEKDFISNRIEL